MANRIYGLSGSGMDVDSLVESLMKSPKLRLDTLKQRQTALQWKKAEYNTVYNTLKSFQDDTVFPYKLQSKLMPKSASVDNSNVASASASADAANFTHTLNVVNTAQGASMTSSGSISTGTVTAFTNLKQQLGMTGDVVSLTISDGTTTKTLSNNADGKYHIDGTTTIYSLVSDINKLGLNVKATYDSTLDRFFLTSTKSGAANQITLTSDDGTGTGAGSLADKLKLGTDAALSTAGMISTSAMLGADSKPLPATASLTNLLGAGPIDLSFAVGSDAAKTLTYTSTTGKTIGNLVDDINKLGNVKATYDASSGRFSISPIGNGGTVTIGGTDEATFVSAFKISTSSTALPSNFTSGKNAVFSLDGVSLNQETNNFTVSGVNYTLKGTGASSVAVASDVDTTVANVKAFVDSYNKMIASLNGELDQEKYKDYLPLTDEQRSGMKESEITAWEAKAKSGLLHNDTILQSAVNKIRNDIYSPIQGLAGKYNSGASIGIATAPYGYAEGGKLYVDETKLRKALQEDPDIVNKIFANNASDSNATHSSKGVTARLYDSLTAIRTQLADQAGTAAQGSADTSSSLAKQLKDYKKQITAQKNRMSDLEKRYYNQFNAMESVLASLNKQSSWLTQQTSS